MCDMDTFKNVTGDQSCTDCPSNLVTEQRGATDMNMCGKIQFQ